MHPLDFLTYCGGISLIILSLGIVIGQVGRNQALRRRKPLEPAITEPKHQQVQMEPVDPLTRRLHQFQETRFAPTVGRVVEQDSGPGIHPQRRNRK
jgi:hypothetical protein